MLTSNIKTGLYLSGVFVVCLIFFYTNPIPQDPAYHRFVDQRGWLAVPNALNIFSNVGFLLVGIVGLNKVFDFTNDRSGFRIMSLRWFSAGVLLTAFGSSYYHWQPDNASLFWDRLPMAISFMAVFSLSLYDFLSRKISRRILYSFILAGVFSVVYWLVTEQLGRGDLRPYLLVQFLPLVLMTGFLLVSKQSSGVKPAYVALLCAYILAKLAEVYDLEIYQMTGLIVSGHSLKHLLAAAGIGIFIHLQTAQTNND